MRAVAAAPPARPFSRSADGGATIPATVPLIATQQATQIAPVTAWAAVNVMRRKVTRIRLHAAALWRARGSRPWGRLIQPHRRVPCDRPASSLIFLDTFCMSPALPVISCRVVAAEAQVPGAHDHHRHRHINTTNRHPIDFFLHSPSRKHRPALGSHHIAKAEHHRRPSPRHPVYTLISGIRHGSLPASGQWPQSDSRY